MKVALVIRGHIRDSLGDDCLLSFVNSMILNFEVDIFIHTWKESEAKSSWRELDRTNIVKVDHDLILKYFDSVKENIKKIIIEDDSKINLFGSVDGNVGGIPKIAWKRMWHGQFSAVTSSFVDNYDLIVNIRFDNFHCNQSRVLGFTNNVIIQKIKNRDGHLLIHGNNLLYGCDNVMIGKPLLMWQLVYYFHHCLDDILSLKLPCGINQEFLVPLFLEKYLNNGVICKE